MRRLDRYIAGTVSSSIMLMIFVITGLDIIFSLVDEMQNLEADYQMLQAFQYVGITIPKRIYEFLSLSVLLGCLVGLGTLANHSELTVMRAAGVSVSRISWAAVKPALLVVCIGTLMGEYVVPYTEGFAQSRRALAKSGDKAMSSKEGYWHREANDYMHFNAVLPNGIIFGVTQYHFNQARELKHARYASRAIFQGDHWVLQGVVETEFAQNRAEQNIYPTLRWDTDLTPGLLRLQVIKPEDLSIRGLYQYAAYLAEQGLNTQKYRLAYWKKISQPLATVVMVLVALSCIFGPLRSVTMGFRVFSGVILGMLFKYTEGFLAPASIVFGFEPFYASFIPSALFCALAILLLKRAG